MIKKSFGAALTASPATIYTVPTGKKADGYSISSKEFFQIGGPVNAFIMMGEGDSISASASQAMTLLISVIETNDIILGG
jgi:hypothetical protein